MRRVVGIVGGVMLVAFALVAVGRPAAAATTYTDRDGRFAFLAPDGYIQRYRAGTDISYRSLTSPTTILDVAVIAQSPEPLPSPDSLAASILSGLRPPAYVGASAAEPFTLGGQAGRRFDYYTTLEGTTARLRTTQIVAVSNRSAMVLVLSATEADYAKMMGDTAIVLTSFSFAPTPGTGSSTAGVGVVASTATPALATAVTPIPTVLPAPVTGTSDATRAATQPTPAPTPAPQSLPATDSPATAATLAPPPLAAPFPTVPPVVSNPTPATRRLGEG